MGPTGSLDKRGTYSLIVDLEGKNEPKGVTATLELGEVIWAYGDFICIGSGEILGGNQTYQIGETQMRIIRKGDLNSVRNIFEKWTQQSNVLESAKELVIKGTLGASDETIPIIRSEKNDTLISVIYNNTNVQVRFHQENLKFVQGMDLQQGDALRGVEVYVCGLAVKKDSDWEILGRSLISVK